jgi:hypothetical protein
MGTFDDWIEEDEENEENNEEETEETDERSEEQVESTKQFIGVNIRDRAQQSNFDIEVQDGELSGSLEDVAMLFAVMTMDFTEAEFDELINDEPSNN